MGYTNVPGVGVRGLYPVIEEEGAGAQKVSDLRFSHSIAPQPPGN